MVTEVLISDRGLRSAVRASMCWEVRSHFASLSLDFILENFRSFALSGELVSSTPVILALEAEAGESQVSLNSAG